MVTSALPDDIDAVVAAAMRGERVALDRLLRSIHPHVVRYCRARFWGQPDGVASADDVAQEVCLTVLRVLPRYRSQGGPFIAFVYGIAANKVAQARRSSRRDRSDPVAIVPEQADHGSDPEGRVFRSAISRRLADLLDELPRYQRTVLVLRVMVGLSTQEAADALGSTPGAIRVAQHRALNRLRQHSRAQLLALVS